MIKLVPIINHSENTKKSDGLYIFFIYDIIMIIVIERLWFGSIYMTFVLHIYKTFDIILTPKP